jgi:hypothetical protein
VPRRIRYVAIACVVLSALCGLLAGLETGELFDLEQLRNRPVSETAVWGFNDPAIKEAVQKATARSMQIVASTLESMREVRALTLIALSIACGLVFLSSARILRPLGLPREGVRRLLAGAALAAGILRTIDGAQSAVLAQRQWANVNQAILSIPESNDQIRDWRMVGPALTQMGLVFSVGWTILIAGAFILASQYFRSETVKKIVQFRDTHPDQT